MAQFSNHKKLRLNSGSKNLARSTSSETAHKRNQANACQAVKQARYFLGNVTRGKNVPTY